MTTTTMNNKVSGSCLQRSVQTVVNHAAMRGVDVSVEELMSIIRTHAAGSAASMAAVGALPGAGSAIAAGVEISFVWSMYFRICTRLGLKAPTELLKGLGSAIITNIAGAVASQIIAGTVLSCIPGIGTLGAAAVNGMMGYSITYYSGIIFMNLLVRTFRAGRRLENMKAEELKQMAKEESDRTSFAQIKGEAKAAYKNRAKDGIAEAIDEVFDETETAQEETETAQDETEAAAD